MVAMLGVQAEKPPAWVEAAAVEDPAADPAEGSIALRSAVELEGG